jgi:hypothetical protein
MATKPAENLVYEFLAENESVFQPVAPAMTPTFEIHPSAYEKRKTDTGIIVGDADSSMLPNGQDDDVTEFDAILTLEIYARVTGKDKTQRLAPRQQIFDIKKKLLQLFDDYPNLNNRGCKVKVLRQARFFDDTSAEKWAIERVPIVLNHRNLNTNTGE